MGATFPKRRASEKRTSATTKRNHESHELHKWEYILKMSAFVQIVRFVVINVRKRRGVTLFVQERELGAVEMTLGHGLTLLIVANQA